MKDFFHVRSMGWVGLFTSHPYRLVRRVRGLAAPFVSVAWAVDVLDLVNWIVSSLALQAAGKVVDGEFASAGELLVNVSTHFVSLCWL
jgi:hypothetical protein